MTFLVNSSFYSEKKYFRLTHSLEKGYKLGIDVNSLVQFEYGYEKFLTDHELNTMQKFYVANRWMYGEVRHLPAFLYPDANNQGFVELTYGESVTEIEVKIAGYVKKNSPETVDMCDENKRSLTINFTVIEDIFEKTRDLIAQENEAYESWIGYLNDVTPKEILFYFENDTYFEELLSQPK